MDVEQLLYDQVVRDGLLREPAVLRLGDRCVIGCWVPICERKEGNLICLSKSEGIQVVVESGSWEETSRLYAFFVEQKRLTP